MQRTDAPGVDAERASSRRSDGAFRRADLHEPFGLTGGPNAKGHLARIGQQDAVGADTTCLVSIRGVGSGRGVNGHLGRHLWARSYAAGAYAKLHNSPQAFTLRPPRGQNRASCQLRAAQPVPAEIAIARRNRLHPVSVFADYRKAANNDGFATLLTPRGRRPLLVMSPEFQAPQNGFELRVTRSVDRLR